MFNLNGWQLDKSKFCCQNVIVYNMDFSLVSVLEQEDYSYLIPKD